MNARFCVDQQLLSVYLSVCLKSGKNNKKK